MSVESLQKAMLKAIEILQTELTDAPEAEDGVGVADIVCQKQKIKIGTNRVEIRREPSTPDGTFGTLFINGKEFCKTCENPWLDNRTNVSCIPTGTYKCEMIRRASNGQEAYWVKDVPGRNSIVIHSGNTIADTKGCPLLGMTFGTLGGRRAVLQSRDAIAAFHREMKKEPFELTIKNA